MSAIAFMPDDFNSEEVERLAAPAETSDPAEILARQELELGFNLHGVEIDIELRIRFGFFPDD